MRELREVFKRVILTPESSRPRQEYAELCRPVEPDRAELIDIQLRQARLIRKRILDKEHIALLERAKTLLAAGRWLPEVAVGPLTWRFHRGFPECLTIAPETLASQAEVIFCAAPVLHLVFTKHGGPDRLAALPQMRQIVSLSCHGCRWSDHQFAALLACDLRRLSYLDLRFNVLTSVALDLICENRDRLPSLRYVALRGNSCVDPADTPKYEYHDWGDKELLITGWSETPEGRELERRFGPQSWLHYRTTSAMFYPPWFDEFVQFEDDIQWASP